MDWKLFIARRIYKNEDGGKEVSKPAVRIAMIGIAVGLAVMIVSVAVVLGFKHQIHDKVVGLGADILVTSLDEVQAYQVSPIVADDSLMGEIGKIEGVMHVQRYSTKPGMIMTEGAFQGMMLKGLAGEYNYAFLNAHLLEGEIPTFTDSVSSNKVLISKSIADRLSLKLGDKLYTYYLEGNIRARRLTVEGIYQTNLASYDDLFLITDLYTVNRLNNWEKGQVGGLELSVSNSQQLDAINDDVRGLLHNKTDRFGTEYYSRTVEEVYPQIFAWLDLLDLNVWVILFLMSGVAGFTMISGLLIIILERTNMIGVLKAMGATNLSIRKIFLSFSVFLIWRGMLWGNVIGLALCGIQYCFKVIRLDPATYYVDAVPIELDWRLIFLLNVATILVSVLMLIGPSCLITRIHPAKSIRYE